MSQREKTFCTVFILDCDASEMRNVRQYDESQVCWCGRGSLPRSSYNIDFVESQRQTKDTAQRNAYARTGSASDSCQILRTGETEEDGAREEDSVRPPVN